MKQNIDIFDFELTNEDMDVIAAIDKAETLFFSHSDPEQVERIINMKRNF